MISNFKIMRNIDQYLGVDGLTGLYSEHQLIPDTLALKDVTGDIPVLDPNLSLSLIQGLAAPEDEGDTVPTLIVDSEIRNYAGIG